MKKDLAQELAKSRLPGIYVLLFSAEQRLEIPVGRIGMLEFPAGYYGYVGSGMKGSEARVRRHLRPHVRASWHLDYLLPQCQPVAAILGLTTNRLECSVANNLHDTFESHPRFGASDCRCSSHLFSSADLIPLARTSLESMRDLGCDTRVLTFSVLAGDLAGLS